MEKTRFCAQKGRWRERFSAVSEQVRAVGLSMRSAIPAVIGRVNDIMRELIKCDANAALIETFTLFSVDQRGLQPLAGASCETAKVG